MNTFRLYGSIQKVEELPDGTLRVEGIASSETKDSQGEVVKASAIEKAIPGYLRKDGSGPLREMHQPIAAGKVAAIDVQPDKTTYVVAKVIDPAAVLKVKEKVLQGFSIGGHVPPGGRNKDDPKVIEQIVLTEISLVDRPANPDAQFTLVKIDDATAPPPEIPVVVGTVKVPAPVVEKSDAAAKPATTESATAKAEASPAAQSGASAAPASEPTKKVHVVVKVDEADAESVRKFIASDSFLAAVKGELVAKAGAKFSKATRSALGKLHKMVQDCDQGFKDMKYADDDGDDDVESADQPGELQKVQADLKAAKDETAAALDATKQAADALKKVLDDRDALQKAHDALAAELDAAKIELARKGVLRVVPVEKGKDGQGAAEGTKKFEDLDPLDQVKAIHQAGGALVVPRPAPQ